MDEQNIDELDAGLLKAHQIEQARREYQGEWA
jgi:hypothetical protein